MGIGVRHRVKGFVLDAFGHVYALLKANGGCLPGVRGQSSFIALALIKYGHYRQFHADDVSHIALREQIALIRDCQ